MLLKRLVLILVMSSAMTFLCHAHAFASTIKDTLKNYYNDPEGRPFYDLDRKAKKPKANDDFGNTTEETAITIGVLANDLMEEDGDDDDDDATLDPASVDLNPPTDGIDRTYSSTGGSFTVNDNGDVTYVPAVNYTGTASVSYRVNDSEGRRSNTASLTITVSSVNDPPVITGQVSNPLTTNEDQAVTLGLPDLIVEDPDNNYPEGFTLAVSPGDHYTVTGTTIIPDADYSGSLSVPVTVNDGSASSNTYSFQISVLAVNDAPVITAQTPAPIVIAEEASVVLAPGNLTVSDPDNSYPGDFTLQVSPGANYTLSGFTVTPVADFAGDLSVPVTVTDGALVSNTFNIIIKVTPVNDAPVISGQSPDPITTNEDQPATIVFENLVVTDPDNAYPTGFTMSLSPGENYSVSGATITPAPDYAGPLSVPVTVNDGVAVSGTFVLNVLVSGVNDIPVITGQAPLAVTEDNNIAISLSDLQVTDGDNTYPTGFTLALGAGVNYTVSGTTIIPAANFTGILSVPATVNDGTSNSAPFNLQITVNAVNDVPVITGQASLNTAEEQAIEINLSHLIVSDPDDVYPADFTLSVLAGTNYSVSGSVITPASGFTGTLFVGVFVNDGVASSQIYNLQITIIPVNDPPVITGQRALSVPEDNTITLLLSDLTVTDPDNVFPTGFVLTVLPGTDYSVIGNAITPLINFTGVLSVSVKVNDGVDDSAPFAVQVTVTPVNDPPQITGQQPVSTNENQPFTIDFSHLTVSDVDNGYPNGFTLLVSSGADYTVSGSTITPSPGFSGTLTVPVQVNDGQLNSNIFEMQISILPVNDAPVITGQVTLSTEEDVPVTILLSHLTVFDADNTYPEGFSLNVSAGTNYTVAGSTITPALDFTGTLNVTVTVSDGVSNSDPFIFQIQVGDANDPPVITGQTSVTTNEEQAVTIELSHLIVTDPDNSYPTGFSVLVSAGPDFTVAGNTITPVLNFAGTLTIPVRVNDGINNSPTFGFKILVNQVNDPPGFDAIPNQQVSENAAETTISITNITKGPGEDDQQLTFFATSGSTAIIPDPVIAYEPSASVATLTYKPAPNVSGLVSITVVAVDNGATGGAHQNSYSGTFQINIEEINNAPTLDAIANLDLPEDAGEQTIALSGITAGEGELQPLTVEVSSDQSELFEVIKIEYVSPERTGSLKIKPKANVSGTASITVTVTDAGSSVLPSINAIARTFALTIRPVNDPPQFISSPLSLAVVNEPYEYIIEIADIEDNALPFSALSKPEWLELSAIENGKTKLSGIPPAAAAGVYPVIIQVQDGEVAVQQQYSLMVNTRPLNASSDVSLEEDATVALSEQHFISLFSDTDGHSLSAIRIAQKPAAGKLLLGELEIKDNDTIPVGSLRTMIYKPDTNYAGRDAFLWNASDGFHFSQDAAVVDIEITPVNDAPVITLSKDTLYYEVNGEPALLSELIMAEDPDDDSLTQAEVGFREENFHFEYDHMLFENTVNIKGVYDFQTGKLSLTGKAPVGDYEKALRSIQYVHFNTLDPNLQLKRVFLKLNDGKVWSEEKEMVIDLQYTFVDLEIPSGFTPNGDNANDMWIITRPGGLEPLNDAVIRIFNKRGIQVFQAEGFDQPWDGTYNGQLLPADTYFFMIDLNLRSKKTYRGIVTLLR